MTIPGGLFDTIVTMEIRPFADSLISGDKQNILSPVVDLNMRAAPNTFSRKISIKCVAEQGQVRVVTISDKRFCLLYVWRSKETISGIAKTRN